MILFDTFLILSLLCAVLPKSYGKHIHIGLNPEPDNNLDSSSDAESKREVEVEILHSLDDDGDGFGDQENGILIMKFEAFGKVVGVNLQRVNSELAGDNTPVFIARSSSNDSNSVTFEKTDDHTLGKALALYQDPYSDSSVAVVRDDDGSPFFAGIIEGFRIDFKPISERKKKRETKRRSIGGLAVSEYHVVSEISRKKREARSAGISALQSRFKRQAEASNSSVIYPQLLVVTDYGEEVEASSIGFSHHLVYILAFFNGVDLIFQQLSDPEVRLHISGIVVDSDRAAAPHINNNRNATGAIDAVAALEKMGEFYANALTDLPPDSYNIIITLINDYICDHHEEDFCSPLLAGVSSLDKRCSDNHPATSMVAIVEDNLTFSGIRTAAHELGHIMGAEHDGEEEAKDCPFEDGYLMARYNDSSTVSLTWSNCSKKYFTEELKSEGFDCLRNVPNWEKEGKPLPLILPSDVATLHHQCLALGYVRNCWGPQNCQALTCSRTEYPFTTEDCEKAGIPAAQGSYCDFGRHCINGECVLES